jgi:hypothetical protein
VVIRIEALFDTSFVTVLDAIVPAHRFHRQIIALELRGITSHDLTPLFLSDFIFADVKVRYGDILSVVAGLCVFKSPAFDPYKIARLFLRPGADNHYREKEEQ